MKNPFADENVTSENLWIPLTIPVALVLGAVGAGVVVLKKPRSKRPTSRIADTRKSLPDLKKEL